MHTPKYYRLPWTKEKVDLLIKHWPHFGSDFISKELNITVPQIKSKVNKLKLILLPKKERICASCKINNQTKRAYGILCKNCHLQKRKIRRSKAEYSLIHWIKEASNACRSRNKLRYNYQGDNQVTFDFLLNLLNKQKGLCHYSKIAMQFPKFKKGRQLYSASIDRIDSNKPYTTDNVVWCCWAANVGKNQFKTEEYIDFCAKVYLSNR